MRCWIRKVGFGTLHVSFKKVFLKDVAKYIFLLKM